MAKHVAKHAKPIPRKHRSKRALAAVFGIAAATALIAVVPLLAQAWNNMQTPSYDWYTSGGAGTEADPYKIANVRDYRGFVDIVNGTVDLDEDGTNDSDSFAGKYVVLTSNISLNTAGESNVIDPIGGAQTGKSFNGTFDGQGHSIDNYTVTVAEGQAATNLGLFGECGAGSTLKNVVVGASAKLSITKEASDVTQIKNVGLLVGYTQGSLEGCTNKGSVIINSAVDQTKDMKFVVLNVGGLAGQCLGNITNCTNNGTIEAYATGTPRSLTEEEISAGDRQESIIMMNVGGIVGCAGAQDHKVEENSGEACGLISGCTNTGKLSLNTPAENGKDRFGSTVYAESSNTGGIAGYSRGSVENCTNSGYIRAEKGTYAAGVIGCLRARSVTISSAAPAYYYDDGMLGVVTDDTLGVSSYDKEASEAKTIHVTNCHNKGDVMGNSSPAGVVAAAGTYTEIEGCTNAAGTIVMGTRWNKPFPAGITSSTYGQVRYCANYGTVMSGKWNDEEARTYTLQDGYYASGIAGATRAYEDKKYNRLSPVPEVYGCYNTGSILAGDNMRQRGIVGDNEGNVYNNLLLENVVYNDRIAYGLYSGDDEAGGGSFSNNYVISADLLKNNGLFSFVSTDAYKVEADDNGTMSALSVLNAAGDSTSWCTYWVSDTSKANSGYPVLNTSVDWELTPITNATVELEENAAYTSVVGSVPRAKVTLNGKQLVQGVDFRVVPDATAIEITEKAENTTPYTATVVGIGNYTGTAAQTFNYGILTGDISTCSASVESTRFDWEAHTVTPGDVTLTTLSGTKVDPSEYTVAFDQTDPDLTVNEETGEKEAVNAGKYDLIITASSTSEHFSGSTTTKLTVETAKIMYSLTAEQREKNALPSAITYAGNQYDWESTIYVSSKDPAEQIPTTVFEYTGHPIDPQVVSVTYKGKELVEGRDYRVLYGDMELLEKNYTIPSGQENVGVKGGTAYGYIMVKNIPGGNFGNYEIMPFLIVDTDAKVDMTGAEVRGGESVIYEGEQAYEPITLWYQNQQLTEGTDYTITYTNNTSLGTASYVATACEDGPFEGTISGTFDIVQGNPYSFYYTYDDTTMTATVTGVSYNGINDTFDMVIPAQTTFEGGEYTKISYGKNNLGSTVYTAETATATAGTYTVCAIGDYAFGGSDTRGSGSLWTGEDFATSKAMISGVTIPYTVKTIGKYAFAGGSTYYDWRLLSSVTFSDVEYSQLTTIEEGAFQACGNLSEFTFPAQVDTIEKNAFRVGSNNKARVSKLKKLTFLTQDENLPSNVSTNYTFGGVGGIGGVAEGVGVQVYGYDSATAVKALVTANSNQKSWGENKGMSFTFTALDAPAQTWSVSTQEYVLGSGLVTVTHNAVSVDNASVYVNGEAMYWNGTAFETLMTPQDAKALTSSSFTLVAGDCEEVSSGDANGNGQVNVVDAQIAYDVACGVYQGLSVLPAGGWFACDANGDGAVDAADALAIQNYALGKITVIG